MAVEEDLEDLSKMVKLWRGEANCMALPLGVSPGEAGAPAAETVDGAVAKTAAAVRRMHLLMMLVLCFD